MANKIRLSVPFSPEVYKRIEIEAEIRGVSMSTYVAFIVGDHFVKTDAEFENQKVVNQVMESFLMKQNEINEQMEAMVPDAKDSK